MTESQRFLERIEEELNPSPLALLLIKQYGNIIKQETIQENSETINEIINALSIKK